MSTENTTNSSGEGLVKKHVPEGCNEQLCLSPPLKEVVKCTESAENQHGKYSILSQKELITVHDKDMQALMGKVALNKA